MYGYDYSVFLCINICNKIIKYCASIEVLKQSIETKPDLIINKEQAINLSASELYAPSNAAHKANNKIKKKLKTI